MAPVTDGSTPNEEQKIDRFLGLVGEMLERSDYLLPLAAGQRQFRQDNYNMASAALLEDLFFDALGMFVRENHPRVALERRTGRELWDYGFDGLLLSHKETLSGAISVWWTAGDRPDGKNYVPKPEYRSFSAAHPIVMVYSGCASFSWTSHHRAMGAPRIGMGPAPRTGKMLGTLGSRAITGEGDRSAVHSLVLARQSTDGTLLVEQVWRPDDWSSLTFNDLWPLLGGPGIGERDLWVDRTYAGNSQGLASVAELAVGAELVPDGDVLLPGIYVMPTSEMQDVPMVANNRAHSVHPDYAREMLLNARVSGRYVAFPSWFAHYAVSQPPNLYAKQREQYEALFAARRR